MFKKILIAFDGSKGSVKYLKHVVLLARASGDEIHTISVEDVPRLPGARGEVDEDKEASDAKFAALVVQAKKMAADHFITLRAHAAGGHAVQGSVECTKDKQFDLLAVGVMGHSALYEHVIRGTCQAPVSLAPCAVLVVQ